MSCWFRSAAHGHRNGDAGRRRHTSATSRGGGQDLLFLPHLGLGAGEEQFLAIGIAIMRNEGVRSFHGVLVDVL